MNAISKLAIVFVVAGAVLLSGPAFGFSSFAADRGTTADIPSDQSNAYLGLGSEGDVTGTELRGDSDPLKIGTLSNNVDETLEVKSITVDSIGGDSTDDTILAVASPISGDTIGTGSSTDVTVECADDQSVGEREVVIRVNRVGGPTISVSDPTFNATVDIQCGKGKFSGSAGFSVSDVTTSDTTQTVSFDVAALGNNDVATINFSESQNNNGVDYSGVTDTDLTIQTQSHKGDASFDSGKSQLTYSPQGNEDGEITIEISNIDVTGDPGESYQVTYSDTTSREDGGFFEIT